MALKIFIVGAGIAGLGAAYALSQAGHNVEVFEQSSFSNEVGAAIHIAPNASRILARWGVDFGSLNPSYCRQLCIWNPKGEHVATPFDLTENQKALGISDDWLLCHRVDLHNSLKELVEKSGIKIHLGYKVREVDPKKGEILLESGRSLSADLIVGADGAHSVTVEAVMQQKPNVISTGQSCYRFLIPKSKLGERTRAKDFYERLGPNACHAIVSSDRRLIIYPCRDGELLNVAGICPAPANEDTDKISSWQSSGEMEELLATYSEFSPEVQDFCSLGEDLKRWSMTTRDPPRSFYAERLVLIGDAAHPTLPHQGQGGAQAIEDCEALATALCSVDAANLTTALKVYNTARYNHSVTVMFMSRYSDDKRLEALPSLRRFVPDAELPDDMSLYAWSSYPAKAVIKASQAQSTPHVRV